MWGCTNCPPSDHSDTSPVDKPSEILPLVPDNDILIMDSRQAEILLVPDDDTSPKDRSALPDSYISFEHTGIKKQPVSLPVSLLPSCAVNLSASAITI